MSIMFSRHSWWSRVQALFALIAQEDVQKRHTSLLSPAQPLQMQVRQVADACAAAMPIWQVEDSLEIKAHIACWHRCICTYRGYILCSDTTERTFLMDMRTWTYVAITNAGLLQIDGVKEAKMFVDALCHLQEKDLSMSSPKSSDRKLEGRR